jgi:uncharacterized heparinase superfamily protein
MEGHWDHAGQRIDVGAQGHPFSISLPSEDFASWVHGFAWLPDLLCVKGGSNKAKALLSHWIAQFPLRPHNNFVSAPDRLALRLFQWGRAFDAIKDSQGALLESYFGQMRRLRRAEGDVSEGLSRLYADASSVMFGARLVDNAESWLARGLDRLDEQLGQQILADGGHVSRSPFATLQALEIAIATDAVLNARGLSSSRALSRAIDRMAPMIQTLRHTDGGLGVFQGGHEGVSAKIDAILAAVPGDPQSFSYARHTGYHRMEMAGTVLLTDTANAAPFPHDGHAHLAPLAMELSTAEGRLIVNCGWHPSASQQWRRPVRSSAAHSTLIINENSPGKILEEGLRFKAFGAAIAEDSDDVRARLKEQSAGLWLEGTHHGYMSGYGLVHRRRLFMGEDGDDVRGEDSLFVPAGRVPLRSDRIPFALRFHFHPDVRVSLAQDLSSALLVQRGRAGWRFRTDGGPIAVEPSVYLGASARPVRAQQLVIRGEAYGDSDGQGRDNRIRWSVRRLRPRRSDDRSSEVTS